MRQRLFFRAEDIVVNSTAISVGNNSYDLKEWSGVRSERAAVKWLHWLRGPYRVLLIDAAGNETEILHHRNAYFVFQLVHAIQTALADERKSAGSAGFVDASAVV